MLIFVKGEYLPLIASGAKTTTIRPWKVCRLRPGQSVLSFNGKLRALVTHVEQRALDTLTTTDAVADGFPNRAALRLALRHTYPHLVATTPVWVIHFRREDPTAPAPSLDPPPAPHIQTPL